jgi:putative two-component system response regulator
MNARSHRLNWGHQLPAAQAPRPTLTAISDLPGQLDGVGSSEFRQFLQEHHSRVGELCRILSLAMGLSEERADSVARAGALHDIGKLFVPEAILQHPGPLNAAEQMAVRQHSFWGYVTLRRSDDPVIQLAATVALQHHECWDGSGYPFGLAGEDICLEARIVTICDVYDALRAQRPYKAGFSHEEAMGKILRGDERISPAMFDPDMLTTFEQIQASCSKTFETLRPGI